MTTQAISIPSMIPAQSPEPEVMYIPQKKYGKISYFMEIEQGRTREAELVADIIDGEILDISRILAVDLENGSSWDATKDIMDAVFCSLIRSGSNIPAWLISSLEDHIPMNELAPYLRRLAA